MAEAVYRRPVGWTIAWILLGLYLLIKLVGWWYGISNHRLEVELMRLKPQVSELAYSRQLKSLLLSCEEALRQTRQLGFEGAVLLQRISQEIPREVTLRRLEADSQGMLIIAGEMQPGERSAEELITPWVERLKAQGYPVKVQGLSLVSQETGRWRFELRSD